MSKASDGAATGIRIRARPRPPTDSRTSSRSRLRLHRLLALHLTRIPARERGTDGERRAWMGWYTLTECVTPLRARAPAITSCGRSCRTTERAVEKEKKSSREREEERNGRPRAHI